MTIEFNLLSTIFFLSSTWILMQLPHLRSTNAFILDEKIGSLKIAAFNVRHFGRGYIDDKPEAISHLVKILARYDVVLVQETRDSTGTALQELNQKLRVETGDSWEYIVSEQLGRNNAYLEQYVFFYRVNSAMFVTSYQVNDTEKDIYAREPFCVEFAFTSASKSVHRENVVLMALHTPPEETRKELEELPRTVKFIAALFPHAAGIIAMGDFNADCRYLAGKWRKSLEIFNGEGFKSLIADSEDTATKGSSDCTYDRVVLYGDELEVSDAKVFNYQSWLGLDEAGALNISDHFPVEFVLN